MTETSAVYDGRDCVGSIRAHGKGFAACDPDGRTLGKFQTEQDAVRACLDAARKPARAEALLLQEIETKVREVPA